MPASRLTPVTCARTSAESSGCGVISGSASGGSLTPPPSPPGGPSPRHPERPRQGALLPDASGRLHRSPAPGTSAPGRVMSFSLRPTLGPGVLPRHGERGTRGVERVGLGLDRAVVAGTDHSDLVIGEGLDSA